MGKGGGRTRELGKVGGRDEGCEEGETHLAPRAFPAALSASPPSPSRPFSCLLKCAMGTRINAPVHHLLITSFSCLVIRLFAAPFSRPPASSFPLSFALVASVRPSPPPRPERTNTGPTSVNSLCHEGRGAQAAREDFLEMSTGGESLPAVTPPPSSSSERASGRAERRLKTL